MMDLRSEAWAKVCGLAQEPWVPTDTAAAATYAVSGDVTGHYLHGAHEAFHTPITAGPTLVSLHNGMIEQRLAINQNNAGDSAASSRLQQAAPPASSVLELVLDRMALRDCGDCGGTVESPLCNYRALRRLAMNFNAIATLYTPLVLAPLQDLRELELDFNKLQAFGPLKNSRLETLSINHNALSAVAQLALPRLHTLDLSHNQLGKAFASALAAAPVADPLLRLPNLTHLDVSHNQLTSIEWIGALTKLVHLNVAHNKLGSLNGIQTCAALEELDASHNCLRYLPTLQHTNALRALGKTLTQLDVSHNEISSLGFFPNGCLTNVWSLSIASNAFHGRRQSTAATVDGGTAPRAGGGRRASSIFASDDIGSAAYDDADDGGASVATTAVVASSRGALRSPSSQTSEPLRVATASEASVGASTKRRQAADDAVTFLARLAQLFPAIEVLDVSLNSEEIIADVSDLRFLAKCTNLSELKCAGTLVFDDVPSGVGGRIGTATGRERGRGNKRVDAVLSFLPQIEVLDGEVLVRRDAGPLAVEDLEHTGRPKDAARPTSAGGVRHQLVRPGTSSRQISNAISASKAHDDLGAFQADIEAFMRRAETSRRKVDALLDHLTQTTAWAYGDGPEPEAVDMQALEAHPLSTKMRPDVSSRGANLSDSDDDVAPGVDRLSFDATPTEITTPPSSAPANITGRRTMQQQTPTSPQPPKSSSTAKEASPSKKRLEQQQRSASVQQRQRTPTIVATANSTGRCSSTSRVAASGLYAESEAMKRIKSLPSASFSLEQSRFKEELALEAQRRREQLSLLTKASSAKLPAPKPKRTLATGGSTGVALNPTALTQHAPARSGQHQPNTCEMGTSMVSPAKAGSAPNNTTNLRSSNSAGNSASPRTTVTTATSPSKSFVSVSAGAGAGASSTTGGARAVSPPPSGECAVPALNLKSIPPASTVAQPTALDTDGDLSAHASGGSNTVVAHDPRSVVRPTGSSAVGTPCSATPSSLSDDGASRTPTGMPDNAAALGGTLRPTSAGASSRRVIDRNATSVPKVRVGKQLQDWNPLLKCDVVKGAATARPQSVRESGATVAHPQTQPTPSGFADDDASDETVFFSTKPVDVLQKQLPRAGGTSLNGRRK